jgi:hypothetical protein
MKFIMTAALAILLALPLAFMGCGKSEEKGTLDKLKDMAENMQTAAEEMEKTMSEEREPVPPVNFRVLLNYLPESVEGLTRREPSAETASIGEWQYSQAKANYYDPDGHARVDIEIFDYAHIGMLYAPYTMLIKMKLNKEGTSGYERSAEIAGFPAYESWSINSERAEANVLVGDRFIVKITTNGLPEGAARNVLGKMNLKKLADEKGQPAV